MKKMSWTFTVGALLLTLSAGFYLLHYLIFRDAHHIFLYLIGDLAFLFLDVFIVLLLLEGVLANREKRSIQNKLNMVIGTFFSEVGTDLLKKCVDIDQDVPKLEKELKLDKDWTEKNFAKAKQALRFYQGSLDHRMLDLEQLRSFLIARRGFLLSLLENPNLLEHESFTDLLWTVFHLTDELANRTDLRALPETDRQHLAGDISRVYLQLARQWLDYMQHLRGAYPYLFSLAARKNPFDPQSAVVVKT